MSLILFCFTACTNPASIAEYTWHGRTMGTAYMVKISQANIKQEILNRLIDRVESALIEVNHQMSTYDSQSEISRFNQFKDTTAFEVSTALVNVIQTALEIYHKSEGAFDITIAPLINLWGFGTKGSRIDIPSEKELNEVRLSVGSHNLFIVDSNKIKKKIPDLHIDLGAIAKGYGVDVVADIIHSFGYQNFMVEIGGEVVAQGINAQSQSWKVGIDRPEFNLLPGEKLEAILALTDIAVATSGDYRNYFKVNGKQFSHTIDPKSGRPISHGLASATIMAPSCMLADGLATAVMVMGAVKGLPWIENIDNVEAFLIVRRSDGTFDEFQTSGFVKFLNR